MLKSFALAAAALLAVPTFASAETASFTVVSGGKNIGHLIATTTGDITTVDFDIKNNGRGPTDAETIKSNAEGLPINWKISGATTFGSKVAESFHQTAGRAEWTDSTGKGQATVARPGLYVTQAGSPWGDGIIAKALLKAPNMTLAALPGGTLHLEKGETLTIQGAGGPVKVTRYDLLGIDLTPTTLLLDPKGELFAEVDASSIIVRKGYEGEEVRLRKLAADWSAKRFVDMEKAVAHRYAGPVRIKNVRLFDPKTSALTQPVSVVMRGKEIAAVESLDSPATPGEVTIDGAGGTLVAGLYEMHAHIGQDGALLNLIAGITTVRDMGNDNAVLDGLIQRMDAGEIGGPHVIRSGFIEGKSPYSANNGIVVDSQQAAIDAVRWYEIGRAHV